MMINLSNELLNIFEQIKFHPVNPNSKMPKEVERDECGDSVFEHFGGRG